MRALLFPLWIPKDVPELIFFTTLSLYIEPEPPEEKTTATKTSEATTTEAETTELVCQNGGTPLIESCKCPPQYSGRECERLVRDCSEVFENGYTNASSDGFYFIQPITAPSPIKVRCQFAWDVGVTYTYYRPSDSDFNKNWTELKNGFGDPENNNYFIGLENMHHVLRQGSYLLHIYFTHGNNIAGSAFYNNFAVASEADFYRVSYDSFETVPERPAENGFSSNEPVLFSAPGQDTNGCASSNGGESGWYGADCSTNNGLFASTLQWPVGCHLESLYMLEFNLMRQTPLYE
ncbi:hypothetical protein BaRGS_00012065 [Batillaria attramentaria]|uniref:Fibrinogen C-terminal domain-containing protein n=1 Tax=Batillaria attramentaria TaxID=370345 RepID=A0ABD0LBA6_9CAEN